MERSGFNPFAPPKSTGHHEPHAAPMVPRGGEMCARDCVVPEVEVALRAALAESGRIMRSRNERLDNLDIPDPSDPRGRRSSPVGAVGGNRNSDRHFYAGRKVHRRAAQ